MEEQIDFFKDPDFNVTEFALMFQQQLMDLTKIVAQQQEVMTDMAELIKQQKQELSMLVGDKYRNEPKLYQLEQKVDRLDHERNIRDDVNFCNMDVNRAVQEMYTTFQRQKNSNLTLQTMTIIEIFKLFLDSLSDGDKAEIISKMASGRSEIMTSPIFGIGTNFGPQDLLKEAAKILEQPDSIITLYK